MGKPVERQNHTLSFFILAALIAIATGWSFYEEYLGRRPWKEFQEKIFGYQQEKGRIDLRQVERKLESGDIKVTPDPEKPEQTLSLDEAKARVAEIEKNLAKERGELEKLRKEIKLAEIEASDADLKVKYLRSEDDGLFYEFQHAEHEEALERAAAAKLKAAGNTAEAGEKLQSAEAHGKHREQVVKQRAEKAREIEEAVKQAEVAAKTLSDLQETLGEKVGERDRLKAAIEAALDPLLTAKTALENLKGKSSELTQFWLTSYDNSVDRCQNCHAAIDKCGFSKPYEILAAAAVPNAKPEEVAQNFCVNADTLAHYTETNGEVCGVEFDEAASIAGKIEDGRCFEGEERKKLHDFVLDYCGPKSPPTMLLAGHTKAACISNQNFAKLAAYVEDPKNKGACDIALAAEGESCVEGAKRDQLLTWLERSCNDLSATLKGLRQFKKACASGDAGKKLADLKPVLFDYPVWAQTHPDRSELFGKHPPERFGCTSCHEGQGAQTKGIAGRPFAHGYDDHYWEKPMLDLVSHKKYRPESFGPAKTNEAIPGVWVTHEKQYVQSSCAKCHTEEIHLKNAETYAKGRRFMAEIGCHGCHPVDIFRDMPKLGPTLTDLKKKTTPEFLLSWVAYPKSFRPRTKMPNFWPEALDAQHRVKADSPELAHRTKEVRAIVAYLWKNSEDSALPAPPAGNVERGKVLAQQVGCRGCHNFVPPDKLCTPEQIAGGKSRGTPTEPGECEVARSLSSSDARDFGPNLSNVGLKARPAWLFAWLKNPSAMWAQTRMPNLRLSDQEAADITAYLMTLRAGGKQFPADSFFANEKSPEFAKVAEEGHRLISKYGCAGCHQIKGHEDDPKIGADLNEYGRKTVDLLDFGNAIPNPRHHTWFNFVDLKVRAPRVFGYERVEARMPQFDLNDDEVDALMVFLKSRTSDKVPASYMANTERRTAVAKGDREMDHFNCKGCHVIDGEGGGIRDIYAEDDIYKAPPVLQQQGWRVQPSWLFGFLKDPSPKLRPWLDIRMPTFPLGDEGATTLVHSFSASSNVRYPYLSVPPPKMSESARAEAQAMVEELRCFSCHTAGEPKPDQDKSSMAPNLQLAKHRLRPDWIVAWLKNPQSLQEGTRMPSFFTPDSLNQVMYPKYFGGSQVKQIDAISDYLMTLPDSSPPPAASKPQARR